jgi:hypothetical protein
VECRTHGRGEKVYKVLMGKPEVKRSIGNQSVGERMESE